MMSAIVAGTLRTDYGDVGRGLCVNLDVYTVSDLNHRLEYENLLEPSLASVLIN